MKLGHYNNLEVARETSIGLYLTSDDGDLLLPEKYVPVGTRVGDVLRVFVYRDSEDRLIATTLQPFATADSFAARGGLFAGIGVAADGTRCAVELQLHFGLGEGAALAG